MTNPRPRLRRTLVAVAAVGVLTVAGCGEDEPDSAATPAASSDAAESSPSPAETEKSKEPKDTEETSPPAEAEEVTVGVTITGDEVTPIAQSVEIEAGETVTLNITSDRAGELHVHSTPEQELTFEAGSSKVDITLEQPGSVDIEEHESGALIVRVLVQ